MKADTVAKAFIENWIARYGVPHRFSSDRGQQFVSNQFRELTRLLGAEHIKTTTYHPQSQGKIERFHRQLKAALSCLGNDWITHLPTVLLGIRATSFDDSGISRAEAMFGKPLQLPGEFIEKTEENHPRDTEQYVKQLRNSFQELKPQTRKRNFTGKFYVPQDLFTTNYVFLRVDKVKQPLEMPYEGLYKVTKRRKKWLSLIHISEPTRPY